MKQILLLTDFSENATHAAKCAVLLAAQLNINVVLYHSYPLLSVAPIFTGESVLAEVTSDLFMDTSHRLRDLETTLVTQLNALKPAYCPQITLLSDVGSLGDNVADTFSRLGIELIVMGARQSSGLSHLLEGSATRAVIDAARAPVLIVPPGKDCVWDKILLATAFHTGDFSALECLLKWKEKLNFELGIVHVQTNEDEKFEGVANELLFREKMTRIKDKYELAYYDVRGRNIGMRLFRLCQTEKAGVLALVHYHRGLLTRISGKSRTIDIIDRQHLPLLVFPPK